MEAVVADSMAGDQFLILVLLAFAAVALILALVGVYGCHDAALRPFFAHVAAMMMINRR